ncbi:MAG: AAA family ATPase [Bacteroidota bacterium]
MAALYGANGAGKSNVIRAISTFQNVVGLGAITTEFVESKNEFALEEETQLLGIEFIYNNKYYSYAFEYCQDKIQSEELYIIRNNIAENELVFKRYQENNELIIELNEEIRKDQEAVLFFKLLQNKTLGKKELLLTKVLTLGYEDNKDINSVV